MIIEHQDLITPDPSTRLFRYCSFIKFKSLVETSQLYFRHITEFKDKNEGKHTQSDVPIINSVQCSACSSSQREPFNDQYYVNCWTEETPDNIEFWNQYAPGKDGVAISTNVNRIKCALYPNKKADVFISHINYIDRSTDYTFKAPQLVVNMIEKCFTKDIEKYSWEKEVRLMYILKNARGESIPVGIFLPVELDILIDYVYVSPYADEAEIRKIRSLMRRNNLHTKPIEISKAAQK